jgi:HD-GYP domain-containing protein (c-di-GMP phosphodiesterase class II)
VTFRPEALSGEAAQRAVKVSEMLEKMRPEAYAHAVRVADLTTRVATHANVPTSMVGDLYWGAMLHDIGELNVRRAIWDKPNPLEESERIHMCDHSVVGARWLAGVPGLATLVPFARWHHERFDGLGYPDGCGGQNVPIGVALVGVCDTWDALTQARPYREPMTVEAAAQEMRRHAGRQWSRSLVEWLLACVGAPAPAPVSDL